MFYNIIKKKSRNAFYMLRECFIKATDWFQESSSRVYPKEQIITDAADDKINKIIIKMIYKQFYDDLYHQVDENGKCNCSVKADLGLPCPKQIEYLKDLGIEVNDMVSKDWLCSTYRKAYDTIAQKDNNPQSFQMKIQNIKIQDADLIASKIRYLYQNSPEYRVNLNQLIEEAQIDVQLPLFSLINSSKKKSKKNDT